MDYNDLCEGCCLLKMLSCPTGALTLTGVDGMEVCSSGEVVVSKSLSHCEPVDTDNVCPSMVS